MALNFDLHCHSTFSDGVLTPSDLLRRAAANGVSALALTDHDNVSGLSEAAQAAQEYGIRFVPGVEISTTWNELTIHIVGLGIDYENVALREGLEHVRSSRGRRAELIAAELDRIGIEDSLEGAYAYAQNPELVSRTHFARFLVTRGYASDVKAVFQHFLVPGKPGYVAHEWCAVAEAVSWIRASGGQAIVAHPGRYKMNRHEMTQFLGEFKEAGGTGIEVVTGSHSPEQYGEYARRAHDFELLASRGSDFHGPGEARVDLGRLPDLPRDVKPVWRDWL
jgi:Predicted metal-dependent phosphoesterases (PHP family)